MKPSHFTVVVAFVVASLVVVACTPAAPPPTPTKVPVVPTKAAEPAKAPAAPTTAPTAPAAAAPAKKVEFPAKGKAITMIVGWTAGGAADSAARLLAAGMERELGSPIEVVNKVGATGQIAYTEVANAKPDGYTFGQTNLPGLVQTYLDPERKAVYNMSSYQPVAQQVLSPSGVAVRADSPYKTMKDLVDAAKAKPETIKGSTSGVGGSAHAFLLLTQQMTGAKFNVVHFPAGPEAMSALLGGHTDAHFETASLFPTYVKNGQVRVLGVGDPEPSSYTKRLFPDVKTMEAQGYPKLNFSVSYVYSVPRGTPREIVDILATAIKKEVERPEHKQKLESMGFEVRYMGPDEYVAYWRETENQIRPLMEMMRQAR